MKVEARIFGACAIFVAAVIPLYWLLSGDWTGTSALTMTALLAAMVWVYLWVQGRRMDDRPEDLLDAEIADGAGELGFFPPYSWWPLWCSLTLATMVYALAMGAFWLFGIGALLGSVALIGWVFEYYRGNHAH